MLKRCLAGVLGYGSQASSLVLAGLIVFWFIAEPIVGEDTLVSTTYELPARWATFSADSTKLYVVSAPSKTDSLVVLDAKTGRKESEYSIDLHTSYGPIFFSRDASRWLTPDGKDGSVVWNVDFKSKQPFRKLVTLENYSGVVSTAAFSDDGKFFATSRRGTASKSYVVTLWSIDGNALGRFECERPVRDPIAFMGDSKHLLIFAENALHIVAVPSMKQVHTYYLEGDPLDPETAIQGVRAITHDLFVCWALDNKIRLLSTKDGVLRRAYEAPRLSEDVHRLNDNTILADCGSSINIIRLDNASVVKLGISERQRVKDRIGSVASDDGRFFAELGAEAVQIWSLPDK